jgi:hypothetical protein
VGPTDTKPAADFQSAVHSFDYDAKQPLDVYDRLIEEFQNGTLHDITYASTKGAPVGAYLVVPNGKGRLPPFSSDTGETARELNSFPRRRLMPEPMGFRLSSTTPGTGLLDFIKDGLDVDHRSAVDSFNWANSQAVLGNLAHRSTMKADRIGSVGRPSRKHAGKRLSRI